MVEIKICKSVLLLITMQANPPPERSWINGYPAVSSHARKEVVVANERSQALAIRAAWMREMGFSADEIAEACADNGVPINLAEEQENLKYAQKLKEITPSISVLESWTVKR